MATCNNNNFTCTSCLLSLGRRHITPTLASSLACSLELARRRHNFAYLESDKIKTNCLSFSACSVYHTLLKDSPTPARPRVDCHLANVGPEIRGEEKANEVVVWLEDVIKCTRTIFRLELARYSAQNPHPVVGGLVLWWREQATELNVAMRMAVGISLASVFNQRIIAISLPTPYGGC